MAQQLQPGIDAWSVSRFMEDFVSRAKACHSELANESVGLVIGTALISHIVQLLAGLSEGIDALEILIPGIRSAVENRFKADLEVWKQFRHDAAHPMSRLLFQSPTKWHEAKHSNQPGYSSALNYVRATNLLRTGDQPNQILDVKKAISQAELLIHFVDEQIMAHFDAKGGPGPTTS
jgi:hypothetical protein